MSAFFLSFFFIVLIPITSSFSFCCLFLFFAYFFELRYKQEINRWIIDLYYDKIKLVFEDFISNIVSFKRIRYRYDVFIFIRNEEDILIQVEYKQNVVDYDR